MLKFVIFILNAIPVLLAFLIHVYLLF